MSNEPEECLQAGRHHDAHPERASLIPCPAGDNLVGSENLIRPQILNLQRLVAELLPPVLHALAQFNAA